LKKGKVKQGFIYENAQKKMLENCNFCPEKSLILLNKKVYEPCTTQLHCGGHLGGRAQLPDTILEEDHPMTIPSKFGFN
jgi:hypothetical protein